MGYEFDVFLSYTHAFPFGEWVYQHFLPFFEPFLANALNRTVTVFKDRENISSGDAWPLRLRNALAHSRCLVAIWSPSYFNSLWCKRELSVMLHRERQLGYRTPENPSGLIIPVTVSNGEHFPNYAKQIQYFDCRRFARVGEGFKKTERYVEFQDEMDRWVPEVAKVINQTPPWRQEWLEEPVIDISEEQGPPFNELPGLE
ncbi:toll/interleukin-1 receptor domain-containing protein [Candidatus Poribacteria bacterium]|nr:toll/interleukin-1 receptor domain-containing protein [Candidatus Poribacteria bacterium]